MPTTSLPPWLSAVWSRNYIRQAADDGELGEKDASVSVRYVQTCANGHGFDLRIAASFSLPDSMSCINDLELDQLKQLASGAVEGYAGITTAEPAGDNVTLLRWHAAFSYPPQLGDTSEPSALLASIAAGVHETGDVGRATPTLPAGRGKPVTLWHEYAPDASYEEEWLMLDGYYKQVCLIVIVPPLGSGVILLLLSRSLSTPRACSGRTPCRLASCTQRAGCVLAMHSWQHVCIRRRHRPSGYSAGGAEPSPRRRRR